MWKDVIHEVKRQLPPFNEYLLTRFRPETMDRMVTYLDEHFKNVVDLFENRVQYVGYDVLTPLEAVKWRVTRSVNKDRAKINKNSLKTVRFNFKMEDTIYPMYVQLPYMEDGRIYLDDTQFFPLFNIMERLVHKSKDHITIKPGIVNLLFYRQKEYQLVTTRKRVVRDYCITAMIYHGEGTKRSEKPPLALYHLVELGLDGTMDFYGIQRDVIRVVAEDLAEEGYVYFKMKDGCFIRVREEALADKYVRRFVVALSRIFGTWKHYTLTDVYDPAATYFKVALGRFTYKSTRDPLTLLKYTERHLVSYRVYLTPPVRTAAAKAGCPSDSMADLLRHVWFNIDTWLMQDIRSLNLYTKKLGSLEPTIAPLITSITRAQYDVIKRANKKQISHDDIKGFVNKTSAKPTYFFGDVCRGNPAIVHNNWLLSIGLKSRRNLTGSEMRPGSGTSRARGTPEYMMITHPSWMVVESPIAFPSTNPIMTGTINPYLDIDTDGNIIEPEWSGEIADICD